MLTEPFRLTATVLCAATVQEAVHSRPAQPAARRPPPVAADARRGCACMLAALQESGSRLRCT